MRKNSTGNYTFIDLFVGCGGLRGGWKPRKTRKRPLVDTEGIRRFVNLVDQFGMTRDFDTEEDAYEFMRLLPAEFDAFKEIVA